jgi:hypothetical protein
MLQLIRRRAGHALHLGDLSSCARGDLALRGGTMSAVVKARWMRHFSLGLPNSIALSGAA